MERIRTVSEIRLQANDTALQQLTFGILEAVACVTRFSKVHLRMVVRVDSGQVPKHIIIWRSRVSVGEKIAPIIARYFS